MTRFWIGVASRDHVQTGVQGGFCQLCHGKVSAVNRLSPGDWIAYYSPRTQMRGGDPVQAFTAIGMINSGAPYYVEMAEGFVPARRDVAFLPAQDAKIRPLVDDLAFIRSKKNWAYQFRFGLLRIEEPDFLRIASAMGVEEQFAARASAAQNAFVFP